MLATAISMAKPGVRWSEIAEAMQEIAVLGDYGQVVEYVGHGIGRSLHESPQVPNCLGPGLVDASSRGDFTLRPGMVLAIEPMLTLVGDGLDDEGFPIGVATRRLADGWTVVAADGSPAVHVEHTVAITRRGCEVLSLPSDAEGASGGPALSRSEPSTEGRPRRA
jgi:methionyl aminopeptidase